MFVCSLQNWSEHYGAWEALYKRLDSIKGSAATKMLHILFKDEKMRKTLGLVKQFVNIRNDPPNVNPPTFIIIEFKRDVGDRFRDHFYSIVMALEVEIRTIDRLIALKNGFMALLGTLAIGFFTFVADLLAKNT